MAFRRGFRRRKPRVAWLPVFGTGTGAEGSFPAAGYHETSIIDVPTDGSFTLDAFPLTWDTSQDEAAQQALGIATNTLHDMVSGQEYRLRRVVGNCWIGCGSRAGVTGGTLVVVADVAAGLIVAKTNDSGVLTSSPSPLRQEHATYPWIWHRRWLLRSGSANTSGTTTTGFQYAGIPAHTIGYPNVANGPVIDQKTARVIRQEERLVLMVASRVLIGDGLLPSTCTLSVDFNYRLLGSLRTNQGNRRHASR